MSYRLEKGELFANGLKRIATEQIDRALDQLTDTPDGPDEAVHDARKRVKKSRAVLRLVRLEIGEDVYKRENICFRNAGRSLSDVRDSAVMVETLDEVTDYFADQLPADAFADARQVLAEEHQAIKQHFLEQESVMANVATTIQNARKRVTTWPIERADFSAVAGGLKKVYKRGCKCLTKAYDQPEPEKFHEWRKRVKYLWYHARILRPLWSPMQKELADELHNLSDYLGDAHDLAELKRVVLTHPELSEHKKELQLLAALLDQRRTELEQLARPLGERIYAEEPESFVQRMADYWHVLQSENTSSFEPSFA